MVFVFPGFVWFDVQGMCRGGVVCVPVDREHPEDSPCSRRRGRRGTRAFDGGISLRQEWGDGEAQSASTPSGGLVREAALPDASGGLCGSGQKHALVCTPVSACE
ncbi:hypothetical protein NHX12_031825 [Muraenolepis orangiensis]|uniref:Uncharacterized protein n=1 Tax=Muraenolepis orangiensis TaxID=630683 RepID=A0A9Q0IK19_9TELE|nr:hypothetical protein NHX12_031825 [Muraenolepis orangiensis]